jgi:hypothetical protein
LLNSKLEDTLHIGKAMSKPDARAPHNRVLVWFNGGPGIDALGMPVLTLTSCRTCCGADGFRVVPEGDVG